jgi:hypothetical protein
MKTAMNNDILAVIEKRREILEDTINFYNNNPVAINDVGCCYYQMPGTNIRCAVGRLLIKDDLTSVNTITINCLYEDYSYLFPPAVLECGLDFLSSLQKLHDYPQHWIKNKGITKEGEEYANFIKEKFIDLNIA